MRDVEIPAHAFIASCLWVAAVGLLVARRFVDLPALGPTGVVVAVAAATETVHHLLGVHIRIVRSLFKVYRGPDDGPRLMQ